MPPTPAPQPAPPGRLAWLDVSAGVAGDMVLGALVAAGADLEAIQGLVDIVMPDTVRLEQHPVVRAATTAVKVDVVPLVADHHHRPWSVIRGLLQNAPATLPGSVRDDALAVFGRLAAVEAGVHGIPVEDVQLHEVGSWDSIADVVGVCAGLHLLGVTDLAAGPLSLGSGTVQTAHGVLPVPVPAVLDLLAGWTAEAGGSGELATPTGVALVTTLGRQQPGMPLMRVTAAGAGAGSRDTPHRPNVVRLVLGDPVRSEAIAEEGVVMVVLEANVDDLDPRVWPSVLTALLDAGAADAWLVPIVMKKGRPAHTLAVLGAPDVAPRLRDTILELTSTIGVRQTAVQRWALDRGWVDVVVDGDLVAVKVAHQGGRVVTVTPEFDAVADAAQRSGRAVRDVLASAASAAEVAGLRPGHSVPRDLRSSADL